MANFLEHEIACDLYKRAMNVPGENIWNIKINGIHFDPLLDLDYNGKFVKFGMVDFEYIITKNKFDMEYCYYIIFIFKIDCCIENTLNLIYQMIGNMKTAQYYMQDVVIQNSKSM